MFNIEKNIIDCTLTRMSKDGENTEYLGPKGWTLLLQGNNTLEYDRYIVCGETDRWVYVLMMKKEQTLPKCTFSDCNNSARRRYQYTQRKDTVVK